MKANHKYKGSLVEDCEAYFIRNLNSDFFSKEREEYQFLRDFVRPESKILELGCGDGKNVFTFTNNLKTEYTGIDVSKKAIDEARSRFPESQFEYSESTELPFEDGSFDFVYIGFFLYLLDRKNLLPLVTEIDRVLKDDGILALTDFGVNFPYVNHYHHDENLSVHKFNYEEIFSALPFYFLLEKRIHRESEEINRDHEMRVQTSVLHKSLNPYIKKTAKGEYRYGEI